MSPHVLQQVLLFQSPQVPPLQGPHLGWHAPLGTLPLPTAKPADTHFLRGPRVRVPVMHTRHSPAANAEAQPCRHGTAHCHSILHKHTPAPPKQGQHGPPTTAAPCPQ